MPGYEPYPGASAISGRNGKGYRRVSDSQDAAQVAGSGDNGVENLISDCHENLAVGGYHKRGCRAFWKVVC